MRRGLAVCLLALAFALTAAEESPYAFLPEVVASVDGRPLKREEVVKLIPPDFTGDRAARREAVRRAIETRIYLDEVDSLLREAKITVGSVETTAYLRQLNALLPAGVEGIPQEEIPRLAADREFQLKTALHTLFQRDYPEAIRVEDRRVEEFYRLNQKDFLLPEGFDVGIIRLHGKDAEKQAGELRSRLLQGEDFDRLAAQFDPEGAQLPTPELLALFRRTAGPNAAAGSISPPLDWAGSWYLLKLKKKTPAAFVSLADAAPFIREQLAAEKSARALEGLLRKRLADRKIVILLPPVQ